MKQITIILGSDHGGFALKEQLRLFLQNENAIDGISIEKLVDVGTYGEQPCDYPDFVKKAAKAYKSIAYKLCGLWKTKSKDDKVFVILTCGSGAGVSMAANRYKFFRALLCLNPQQAGLSREHNKSNCLCFGQKFISFEEAKLATINFLTTTFEAGRHVKRINKF